MDLILNYNELNINKIYFVQPLHNLIMGNGLHINLKYKLLDLDLNEIILETPVMEAPFGIRKYDETDNKNKNKFYIDLSFKDIEINSEINNFYNKIKEIDEFIIEKSKFFSSLWNLDNNKDIEEMYINQIRYNYKDDEGRYPPTFKIKMSKNRNGIFNSEIYGKKPQEMESLQDVIKKGSKVQIIMKCNGIWSINNKFGITWKVKYIKPFNEIIYPLNNISEDEDIYLLCEELNNEEIYTDFDMEDYYIYLS